MTGDSFGPRYIVESLAFNDEGRRRESLEYSGFLYNFSKSDDVTTETELKDMAIPLNIGGTFNPKGTPTPIARGTIKVLLFVNEICCLLKCCKCKIKPNPSHYCF